VSTAQLSLWGGETGGDLHLEIERFGYAAVEHRVPTEAIDALQEAHADFTDNLPDPEPATLNDMMVSTKDLDKLDFSQDTQKEWHKYRTNTPQVAKPDGYTNRFYQASVLQQFERPIFDKKTELWVPAQEDPKEFFHYTPHMREIMQQRHEQHNWGPIPPEVQRLTSRMHTVHYLARQALGRVFANLETTHPELSRYVSPKDLEISPLRNLLYYKGQNNELAGAHHDRGIFTMQIADSHRGLRIRDPETGEMTLIETPPEVSPVFPALKWKKAFPDSELRSLWHDVTDEPVACVDRHLHGRNIARWALIFFVNSRSIRDSTNKTATHSE
jgi:hypothetical protein